MEDSTSVEPTLQRLLEFIFDCQLKYNQVYQLLRKDLMVNQPITYYLENPTNSVTFLNSQQLHLELESLTHLIADGKQAIIEFIPSFYKSIPVIVQGKVYFVSKVHAKGSKKANLILRAKD